MDNVRYDVGIDIGSVSINCIVLAPEGKITFEYPYKRHFGRVLEETIALIKDLYRRYGRDNINSISFTGNHGKVISEKIGGIYEFDTISQVLGSIHVAPGVRTIISMGGQDIALFQLTYNHDSWELEYFNMNGPCASGTGSFIDQQAERLSSSIYGKEIDLSQEHILNTLEDFINIGLQGKNPANVACRCTVFTKTDMIHLQNKGEKLENIISGLHKGNAANYVSTIVCSRKISAPVIFIGGLASNMLQVEAFRKYYPNIIVPPYHTSLGALGVALQTQRQGLRGIVEIRKLESISNLEMESFPRAPRLRLKKTYFPEDNEVTYVFDKTKKIDVFLGIDIGSTTTKYALIDNEKNIVHKRYFQTQGKPIEVTQNLLSIIREEVGDFIHIKGVATTGSGRNVVGDFINADLIIDEITAHARGGVEIDPTIDTIFEIGGQDSKYIYIENTYPLDFDMNKVCAAGTGSFLHELANKNKINIVDEFQEVALSSERPVKLAERCTVFMESDLMSYAQKGAQKKDLIAGLCYAIVYNYLNRVIGKRKIGKNIMFLGGPSLNKGIVAAFENVLNRQIIVPKHREVLGAFGAALSVREKMQKEGITESIFRGLDELINDKMKYVETICRADKNCHNECKLKIYNFGGRKSVWGGECGRYDVAKPGTVMEKNYFKLRETTFYKFMEGKYLDLDQLLRSSKEKEPSFCYIDGKPTVGMQRALYFHQFGVFWTNFFSELGFKCILSPKTNHQVSSAGIESMTSETCYPVKVSHGHVKILMDKTKYLFLPSMINMPTPDEKETGFYCPMVQSNQYMVKAALSLDEKKLITPTVHFKWDDRRLWAELHSQLAPLFHFSRRKVENAFHTAMEIQKAFEMEMYRMGRDIIKSVGEGEILVVVTGRPYNLCDERLNLRLGHNLSKLGIKAISQDFLYTDDVHLSDFPHMYWGLGAKILRVAKAIESRPNFYGIHLTNFSCGADSFLEHFYKHIMGDKPYLILELDEHSAVAGVMTRLEAYKNVIHNSHAKYLKSIAMAAQMA